MTMPEKITLFELNQRVKNTLFETFNSNYWVIVEISEIKETAAGHCYLELVQKDEKQDAPKAKARATIWAYTFRMLKPYFETSTGRPLTPGIKILILTEIVFHEVYGFSLNIIDIEPTFTIGDIEQQRRETIEKLVSDGIFDMNKGLEIPIVPKRVAVISSTMAAGYQDFVNQIATNQYNYIVEHKLFHATMQGSDAESSIIGALEEIYNHQSEFDLVTIIRGGGSQTDLSCFDSYLLSAHVAQFPLPIITGIGHDKDVSVVDLVANTKLKTPTAVAEFIIDKYIYAESMANDLSKQVLSSAENILINNRLRLQKITSILPSNILKRTSVEKILIERKNSSIKSQVSIYLQKLETDTSQLKNSLSDLLVRLLKNEYNDLILSDNKIHNLNPVTILSRGYSITKLNGKVITHKNQITKGDAIKTILNDGEISSKVF